MEKIILTEKDNFVPLQRAYIYSYNLQSRIKLMSRDAIISVHKAIDHYIITYKRLSKEFNEVSAAAAFHALIDKEIISMLQENNNVSCKRGCSFCCMYNVDCSIDEAELILSYAHKKNIPIDWEKVKRQSAFKNSDQYITQTFKERRCVFLSASGECQVYEHRPSACRTYHVITPAELCDPQIYPDGEVTKSGNVYYEAMDAGMQNAAAENGNLPVMLLQAQKRIEERE